ncbi:MAG: LysM peptidoglycan-binding domain-containing protein [Adhaeribacter sp.]
MNKNGLPPRRPGLCLGWMLAAFVFFAAPARAAAPVDSVGMQVVRGQNFVVHQVKAGETFYVLARTYAVPVKKIMAANPYAQAGLKAGDLVYIPRAKAKKAAPSFKMDAQGNKVHQVSGKQTLYSLSRQYQVAPADIKRWNNLKSDQLQAGQTLIVGLAPKKAAPAGKPASDQVIAGKPAVTPAPVVLAGKKEQPGLRSPDKPDSANLVKMVSQIRESGVAEVINGPQTNKYLALHHSAPVGSYVTVINSMNGRSISVRVIGTLPNTGSNERVIIKLSKKAQQKLVALDQRFLVDVVYTPQ